MNARASAETERLFNSQSLPRKLCVDDESLDSLEWFALVPPLLKVPRTRVAHPPTPFRAVIVNVNKHFVSADARVFIPNYLPGVNLFNAKRTVEG